jgi:hypothetical protein
MMRQLDLPLDLPEPERGPDRCRCGGRLRLAPGKGQHRASLVCRECGRFARWCSAADLAERLLAGAELSPPPCIERHKRTTP